MNQPHGHFAWHELHTTDVAAAKAFYPAFTPWKAMPMEDMPDYDLWLRGDEPIGGVMALGPERRDSGRGPAWIGYVDVYDLDATVRQVTSLGGRVLVAPREQPGVGCWAVIADPQGAEIGIYEPADPVPPDPANRAGGFSWHELITNDHVAAFEFYHALFRWDKAGEVDMGPMGVYQMYGQKGKPMGGMYNRPPDVPAPMWLPYIHVADVKPLADRVAGAGGTVLMAPHEVPGGDWILPCRDAQGANFALHSAKAS